MTSAILLEPDSADACGGVSGAWRPAWVYVKTVETIPTLALERVLIVHDEEKSREHFIREAVFSPSTSTFGFLVPVPTLPELAAVQNGTQLFDTLRSARRGNDRRAFEFARLKADTERRFARRDYVEPESPSSPDMSGGTGSRAKYEDGAVGNPSPAGRPPLEILQRQRIGSFSVFVISAQNATALRTWMIENDLETRQHLDEWTAYYIRLGFYFVAFRYDPSSKNKGQLVTETFRISFDTSVPYYPYREPNHSWTEPTVPRVLDLWLLSSAPKTPVAAHTSYAGEITWEQPWRASSLPSVPWGPIVEERSFYSASSPTLRALADGALADLLPHTPLVLQTYEDQRDDRTGWSDVLMVPENPSNTVPNDPDQQAKQDASRRRLAALLDPMLEPKSTAGTTDSGSK